jgi:hypothetical protein
MHQTIYGEVIREYGEVMVRVQFPWNRSHTNTIPTTKAYIHNITRISNTISSSECIIIEICYNTIITFLQYGIVRKHIQHIEQK